VTAKTYRQVVEELDQARRLLKTQIVHAVLFAMAAGVWIGATGAWLACRWACS
jgi:hypothetical protein